WKDKFVAWAFKDDADSTLRGSVNKISFGFWESYHDMDVVWNYDSAGNLYRRDNGGSPHTDLNDKSTLTAKVIVVQLVKELGPLDEHKHLLYEVVGTGKGYVFQDGTATEISWTKKDRESRTVFTDKKGKKLAFNRGKIMIEILPVDNTVTY
ncbi:MAG: hypothetical protein UX64_C0045G0001, partial [Microgenomates group bacterium GW2011_GWC2_46_7]